MRRGEVWWARIPMSGSVAVRHPMLIVSDDVFNLNPRYSKVMVVHITSMKRLYGPYDWEVRLPKGTAGLKRSSIAKCAEIYTLWKDQLQDPTGTIPRLLMDQVDNALALSLGLPLP